ncbi:MAG: hypothetical protein WC736_05020 [Gallionella sp.]|jgi:hypothetical protein
MISSIRLFFPILLLLPVSHAHAELPDVIGILTNELTEEGSYALDIHANSTPRGVSLEQSYDNEVLNNHGLRLTPTLAYGLRDDLELTVSVPVVREGNMGASNTRIAGARGRLTWISRGDEGALSYPYWGASTSVILTGERFDYGRTVWDIGLIGGYRTPDWHFATNAFIANGVSNNLKRMGPDHALDGKLLNRVADKVWAGVEYYSAHSKAMTVDGVSWFTTRTLFGTIDYEGEGHFLHFGVGRGMNENTDPWTLKFSDYMPL